ncbi:MAG: tetratricopeptide repeat protein [bacterium]
MKKSVLLLLAVSAILFVVSCGTTPEEYYKTAQSQYDEKNYIEALTNLNKAIEKDVKFSDAYFLRTKVKAKTGDLTGAMKDLDLAIKYNPKNYSALYQRGLAKAQERNYEAAIRDYDKTLKLNPKLPDALFSRGFARYSLGDYYGAIDDYTRSLDMNQSAAVFCNRAIANDDLGENIAAMRDYSKAILINPKFAEAYFNRGSLKFEENDVQGACQDWQIAADLGLEPAKEMLAKYKKN